MKTISMPLSQRGVPSLLRYAVASQVKPWKQTQVEKSPFVIEDFIADLASRINLFFFSNRERQK